MKMLFIRNAQRGQAYFEFMLMASFMVGAVFFTLAISRYGALNIRAQTAVRYGGLIAGNQDPFTYASLSSMYQALSNEIQPLTGPGTGCATLNVHSLSGGAPFVGAASPPFWLPQGSVTTNCHFTTTTFLNGSTSGRNLLLSLYTYSIATDASGFSAWFTNKNSKRPVIASVHTFRGPSVAMLVDCYNPIGQIVRASLFPPATSNAQAVSPLTDADVLNADIVFAPVAGNCSGVGSHAHPPGIPLPVPPTFSVPAPGGGGGTVPTGGGGGAGAPGTPPVIPPPVVNPGGAATGGSSSFNL